MRLSELARSIGAELRQSRGASPAFDPEIREVASPGRATESSIVFAESAAALSAALRSKARAVITSPETANNETSTKALLVTAQPRLAFARAARALRAREQAGGVHPTALIAADAQVAVNATVGAYVVVEAGASVGSGSSIGHGSVVGAGVVIGADCRIYPRVVLYPGVVLGERVVVHAGAVLGSDGFGYVRDAGTGEYLPFPQQGTLVIESDVEIGANATVDRGALEATRIRRGTKIDNQVHVGHNVEISEDVVIAAQTGISGSSVVGRSAVVGGQVGIGDHVVIGEGVILGAQAGVPSRKRLRGPGVVFWGTPARPIKEYLKELAALARLARSSKQESEAGERDR